MSIDAAQAFRKQVNGNQALETEVRSCVRQDGSLDVDAVVTLGKQRGFNIEAADLVALFGANDDELSDFELELVSAGLPTQCNGGMQGMS